MWYLTFRTKQILWYFPFSCEVEFLICYFSVQGRNCVILLWNARTNPWFNISGIRRNLWYLTVSYEAKVVTFSFFVRGSICDIWIFVLCWICDIWIFVLCRICDIWLFRTKHNVWYLTCSYEAEVVSFSFFVRGIICDIFLLPTRREIVLFGVFPNKEDYVCIKLEESPLVVFIYSNQKVNIYYYFTCTRIISLYIINFIFYLNRKRMWWLQNINYNTTNKL